MKRTPTMSNCSKIGSLLRARLRFLSRIMQTSPYSSPGPAKPLFGKTLRSRPCLPGMSILSLFELRFLTRYWQKTPVAISPHCVTVLGSVFGWMIFRPFKWVLDCGFVLAGQSRQTRLLLMFISIRAWRLVRVRMQPQPCVWRRLTMQSEVASASLTTVVAQAF